MKISRHNKKTANFPPTDDCIFFFSSRNQNFLPLQKIIQQHNPSDRRLYLFFSGRNRQNRAPNRQTTVSFFFPVIIARTAHPSDRRLYLFFSGRNVSFFSGRNENFPPQQKNCQFCCSKIHTSASRS